MHVTSRARLEKNLDEAICSQKMMTNFLNPTQSYKPKGFLLRYTRLSAFGREARSASFEKFFEVKKILSQIISLRKPWPFHWGRQFNHAFLIQKFPPGPF